jgi:hypothetical protein
MISSLESMDLLRSRGFLSMGERHYVPSELEVKSYECILLSKESEVVNSYFIHQPTKRLLLIPRVDMGVTLLYLGDAIPFEIIRVSSEKRVDIREMSHEIVPRSNLSGRIITIRLNNKGEWRNLYHNFSVGKSEYFYQYTP